MKKTFIILLVLGFLGCAEKKDEDVVALTTKYYAYVTATSTVQSKIIGYEVTSNTGALEEIEKNDLSSTPQGLVVSPNGKFVYCSLFTGGIQVFSVTPNTGALTAVETEAVTGQMAEMAISPNGSYLYVKIVSTTSSVQAFSIDTDGSLTAIGNPVSLGFTLQDMLIDSNSENIYFVGYNGASSNASVVYHAKIGSDGSVELQSLSNLPNNTTNATAAFLSSSGENLYVKNADTTLFAAIARIGISSSDGSPQATDAENTRSSSGASFVRHPSLEVFYSNFAVNSAPTSGGVYTHSVTSLSTAPTLSSDNANSSYGLAITADGAVVIHIKALTVDSSNTHVISTFTADSDGALTKQKEVELTSAIEGLTFLRDVATSKVQF